MFSSQSHLDKKDAYLQNQYKTLKFKCLGLGRFHRPWATKTPVPQLQSLAVEPESCDYSSRHALK